MQTSTSAFWCLFNVRMISVAASSGVLGGGFASFQASTNFLYLQKNCKITERAHIVQRQISQ